MSNNKTVVPGMGNFDYKAPQPQAMNQMPQPQQPQQPQVAPAYSGTHFPGMEASMQAPGNTSTMEVHKPVMGFLYSVSRTANGEYWPLYMGLNTIGRATSCSVRLSEATISDNHAEIVIRQMKNPDCVLCSIQDARSTCGTLLNGSSLGFDAQECHNGDIITIGEHYELYFVLIDAKSLGLEPVKEFMAVPGGFQQPAMPQMPQMPQMPHPMPGRGPAGTAIGGVMPQQPQQPQQPQYGSHQSAGGTMIMPPKK